MEVVIGNTAPLMADGSRAFDGGGHELTNTTTDVTMAPYYDDAAEAELALSTNNDPLLSMIGRNLAPDDRRFAIGVRDVEHLWWGNHSNDPPEWIESDDGDFARVLAEHFSGGGHVCAVGRPDGWEEG